MNIEFDRDELYNDFIQTYSDESHEEIIERIVELKLVKPQTQKIKLEIQKLQQKLNND